MEKFLRERLKRSVLYFSEAAGYFLKEQLWTNLFLSGHQEPGSVSFSHLALRGLQVVSGHNVDQEVKLVKLCYGHGDVVPL